MSDLLRAKWQALQQRKAELQREVSFYESLIGLGPWPGIGPSPSDSRWGAEIKRRKVLMREIDQKLARLERDARDDQAGENSSKRPERITWHAGNWQWADEILRWRKEGFIKGESDTDVLNRMAAHFLDRNGKPFNVRSVLQTYKAKKNPQSGSRS
jgi:hypothetical protein